MRFLQPLLFGTILVVVALVAGYFSAERPEIQYLGNAAGVLLGFVLGATWQEQERQRAKQESQVAFWKEFAYFHGWLDRQSTTLKSKASSPIYATVFEGRLPVVEANHLLRRANDLDLDPQFQREFHRLVHEIRITEDYLSLGVETLNKYDSNFQGCIDELRKQATDLKRYVR